MKDRFSAMTTTSLVGDNIFKIFSQRHNPTHEGVFGGGKHQYSARSSYLSSLRDVSYK